MSLNPCYFSCNHISFTLPFRGEMSLGTSEPYPTLSFNFPCRDCSKAAALVKIRQLTEPYDRDIAQLEGAIEKGRDRLCQVGPTNEYLVQAVKDWKDRLEALEMEHEDRIGKVWEEFRKRWGAQDVHADARHGCSYARCEETPGYEL